MHKILQAGNSKSSHGATIALTPNLKVQSLAPGDFQFFAFTSSALAAPAGAHISGFHMGGAGNKFITAFDVWTDEAISQFAWMVVG